MKSKKLNSFVSSDLLTAVQLKDELIKLKKGTKKERSRTEHVSPKKETPWVDNTLKIVDSIGPIMLNVFDKKYNVGRQEVLHFMPPTKVPARVLSLRDMIKESVGNSAQARLSKRRNTLEPELYKSERKMISEVEKLKSISPGRNRSQRTR